MAPFDFASHMEGRAHTGNSSGKCQSLQALRCNPLDFLIIGGGQFMIF
jgi:hypothetical protein